VPPKSENPTNALRIGLISLGCAKNLVDSEIMLGKLAAAGCEITNEASLADVVIVNTCSFIDDAQEESVDTILESNHLREIQARGQALVVAGCLPQRFRKELPKLIPEVDAFMGVDQIPEVARIAKEAFTKRKEKMDAGLKPAEKSKLTSSAQTKQSGLQSPIQEVSERPRYIPDYLTPRFRLTPRHFTYLKIAEGCNHPCSFCIIPQIRGTHRSRPQNDVVAEARMLIQSGVKELNLISQDTTFYGLDLRKDRSGSVSSPEKFQTAAKDLSVEGTTLSSLLRELNALPGDFWIRLLYTHPAHWTSELIETIGACEKVTRYVDMPLQHIHPVMLERMRRETSREHIESLIQNIRTRLPGIALRTTFIVGFPGETKEYFDSLLDFIKTTCFERLGVFTYSQEHGTRAAKMANQIATAIKNKRRQSAMQAQAKIIQKLGESMIGRQLKVLVEKSAHPGDVKELPIKSWEHGLLRGKERHPGSFDGVLSIARSESDAPDIDGRIFVRGQLPLGDFAQVKITGHTDYDLIADPLRP